VGPIRFAALLAAPAHLALPLGALAEGGHTRQEILAEWASGSYWLFLLVVALFGAFGGVIYELLILKGRLEFPHRADDQEGEPAEGTGARYLYDLGILSRILIGMAAAIVVVWLLDLEGNGSTAVIAGSIVAGATGIAVFRSLQDRLVAVIATRDLAQTQAQAAAQTRKVEEAYVELEKARDGTVSRPAAATRGLDFGPAPAGVPEIDNALRLLGEARALGLAVAGRGAEIPLRERVFDAVAGWAGVEFATVLPESQRIVAVWARNPRNPPVDDGILSVLIRDLREAFPKARLELAPGDLSKDNHVETVGKLADYVEARA